MTRPVGLLITLFLILCAYPVFASSGKKLSPCFSAARDNNVLADGLGHNTFEAVYRSPFGAVKFDQGTVRLRLRTCKDDVERVRVRVWYGAERSERWIEMERDNTLPPTLSNDGSLGPVEFWKGNVPIPENSDLLFYHFEATDGSSVAYYNNVSPSYAINGWGRYSKHWDDTNTFQISVYDPNFRVAEWLKGSVIYQILPDRFRNGDVSNDPITGTGFVFGKTVRKLNWNEPLCDPRGPSCPRESDSQFYGGDLQGVIEKLDYLKELGVNVIYFNPIFQSATNHRYDTQDYHSIDPKLGGLETFRRLVSEAKSRGIRVVLDGVFNHGSADSVYFDLYQRWDTVGACEAPDSPFRSWFYFPHFQNRPFDHARPSDFYYCLGLNGTLTTYESWWGYFEHPVFDKWQPAVRNYFFSGGSDSVARRWIREGTAGWRLDVAGDVSKGEGVDPVNDYWQGFRKAIKAENPDTIMIGEEWGNASSWLLGHEWDSATNYRFRTALLDWLADGCVGLGCSNGTYFEDDDNNWESSNGPIFPISETQFENRLRAIQQDYPPQVWKAMMNPLGSHDTQRVLFVLKKASRDNEQIAREKLKLAALFQFTYPGAPVILYGDEVGVKSEGMYYEGRWKDDPYTRAVYPWVEQGLLPDLDLKAHFQRVSTLRNRYPALKTGDYEPIQLDNYHRVFAFRRSEGRQQIWVVLNRANRPAQIKLPVLKALSDGTEFEDLLNGGVFRISGGNLDCGSIPAFSGRVLLMR
ncbi:MAG: hypothetical protein A2428_14015 [Bdellovibrionales bacterium RIFOXYC1_FULL_54_43]|nr:MAG: hypothetical protein A2428_14015 [Bdellovibrionales bacterium RIFOXYC1_FULL_54_43]OFZ85218.1 MAG: hypothetical protein A2603_08810 [Bdellovibrionales bacterium RIFOXYD1_FULL_55_31]